MRVSLASAKGRKLLGKWTSSKGLTISEYEELQGLLASPELDSIGMAVAAAAVMCELTPCAGCQAAHVLSTAKPVFVCLQCCLSHDIISRDA